FIVGGPVGDFELLLCHGTVCVVGKMRDLILQLSKSSIYSTKPNGCGNHLISSEVKLAEWLLLKLVITQPIPPFSVIEMMPG
ncbi:hypothetical protein KJR81_26520, partial [Klebsiella pneumoniae]